MKNKLVLIGCGNVGLTYIYTLLAQSVNIHEIVLIDINTDKLDGYIADLEHSLLCFDNQPIIRRGSYSDCSDASIVCITAGLTRPDSADRTIVFRENNEIIKDIVEKISNTDFNGIYLVASNPLDIMTYAVWKYSNFPVNKVIGTGTLLDTSRLQTYISKFLDINPKNISALVLGEHGDSQFIPWSSAQILNRNIDEFLSKEDKEKITKLTVGAGGFIASKIGATYYGIASCLTYITKCILQDKNIIIPVSSYNKSHNVFISTPCFVNKDGAFPSGYFTLSKDEKKKFDDSANFIRNFLDELNI